MPEFAVSQVVDAVHRSLISLPAGRRLVVAVAGIPGSGKSTLCAKVADELSKGALGFAKVVPMDGFHLTNAELDARGLRKRKGSPESFDLDAFKQLVYQLSDAQATLTFPIYDRALHEPVLRDEPAQRLDSACRVVIVEGNYLLMDEPGWRDMGWVWNIRVFMNMSLDKAREDVIARHVRGGRSVEDAQAHYEVNDLPNARRVLAKMFRPDFVVGR
jgi:pantothenate kinase